MNERIDADQFDVHLRSSSRRDFFSFTANRDIKQYTEYMFSKGVMECG